MKNETEIIILLALAGIGYYIYNKSETATPASTGVASAGSNLATFTGTAVNDAISAFNSVFGGAGSNASSTNSNSGVAATSYGTSSDQNFVDSLYNGSTLS